MFEYFPGNYPWSMSVMMALQIGGEISEIDEACRPLAGAAIPPTAEQRSLWFESWRRVGDRVRGLAERDQANGFNKSAASKFKRAAVYYMAAERQTSHRDPRKIEGYRAALKAFALSMKLEPNQVQFVDVPYEKWQLPSLYVPPPGIGRGPCMIAFDGFDSNKEMSFLSGLTANLQSRGIGCIHVDHPGIGGAIHDLKLSAIPDIERAATATVDWLVQRPEIDPARIGIIAPSLGGYYAFRSAAFEKRLACAVAHGARWDNDGSHGRILRNPNAARSIADWVDHAMWYYGTKTVEETAQAIAAMTLEGGVAERITCPVLVAHGGKDRQVPIEQAHKMIERTINSPRRDLKIFDDNDGSVEHCGIDNVSIQFEYMTDWIADVLRADQALAEPKRVARAAR